MLRVTQATTPDYCEEPFLAFPTLQDMPIHAKRVGKETHWVYRETGTNIHQDDKSQALFYHTDPFHTCLCTPTSSPEQNVYDDMIDFNLRVRNVFVADSAETWKKTVPEALRQLRVLQKSVKSFAQMVESEGDRVDALLREPGANIASVKAGLVRFNDLVAKHFHQDHDENELVIQHEDPEPQDLPSSLRCATCLVHVFTDALDVDALPDPIGSKRFYCCKECADATYPVNIRRFGDNIEQVETHYGHTIHSFLKVELQQEFPVMGLDRGYAFPVVETGASPQERFEPSVQLDTICLNDQGEPNGVVLGIRYASPTDTPVRTPSPTRSPAVLPLIHRAQVWLGERGWPAELTLDNFPSPMDTHQVQSRIAVRVPCNVQAVYQGLPDNCRLPDTQIAWSPPVQEADEDDWVLADYQYDNLYLLSNARRALWGDEAKTRVFFMLGNLVCNVLSMGPEDATRLANPIHGKFVYADPMAPADQVYFLPDHASLFAKSTPESYQQDMRYNRHALSELIATYTDDSRVGWGARAGKLLKHKLTEIRIMLRAPDFALMADDYADRIEGIMFETLEQVRNMPTQPRSRKRARETSQP